MRKLWALCLPLFAAGAAFAAANVDPAQLQSGTSLNTIGPELLASHLRSDGLRNAMVSSRSPTLPPMAL